MFPTGEGTHWLMVNKEIVPLDLNKALSQFAKAERAFERLSYSHKREYVSWIEEAKRPETRAKRIEQTLTQLTTERGREKRRVK